MRNTVVKIGKEIEPVVPILVDPNESDYMFGNLRHGELNGLVLHEIRLEFLVEFSVLRFRTQEKNERPLG